MYIHRRLEMENSEIKLQNEEIQCPIETFMDVLKGKCKSTIMLYINKGTNRFGELRKAIPTISERMLAKQLRELEEDGILSRTVFPEVPPRVEYEITEYGQSLFTILKQMYNWGKIHQERNE